MSRLAALTAAVVLPGLVLTAPAGASPAACWEPVDGCGFPVTAGHAYTIGTAYQATAMVRAVAYTYSAAAGWREWFTGSPYGKSASWAPLATTTPAVPAGVERLAVAFTTADATAATIGEVSVTAVPPVEPPPVFRPALGRTSGLVTNSYAYQNPADTGAVLSSDWQVTSGSLFANGDSGDTGKIDGDSPGPLSTVNTGSAVFRMHTVRGDFTNVRVAFDLNIAYQTWTARTPDAGFDGVHIWLRHKSQYELYAASVARRDGIVLIKKKCPGGESNGGTYYTLGGEVPGVPIVPGRWRQVSATVQNNPGGSVTVVLYVDGEARISAVDTGVGCAPIVDAAPVGIRGDNTRFRFRNVTVE